MTCACWWSTDGKLQKYLVYININMLVCLFVYTSLVHMDKKLLSFGILMTFFLFFPLTIPCSKKSFYFLALQDFIDREGEAPLEGSIPDMTSSTELATYISSPTTSCSFSPLFSNFWERKYDLVKLEVCLMPLAGYMLPCRRSTKPRLRLIFLLLSKMWAIF